MTEKKKQSSKPKQKTIDGEFFSYKDKPCFWKGKIMIGGKLTWGRVTKEQMKAFKKLAPVDIDLSRWVLPEDPIEKRLKAAKTKMKRKLGIDD